ncbi:MAG: hypothetical protein IPK85_21075 [Gemmatimonadetes bacterium]|nr:hypothetical protein [Gemmatimonadota bacterium]
MLDAAGTAARVIALESDSATITTDGVEILVGDGHAGGDGATLSLRSDGAEVEPWVIPRPSTSS